MSGYGIESARADLRALPFGEFARRAEFLRAVRVVMLAAGEGCYVCGSPITSPTDREEEWDEWHVVEGRRLCRDCSGWLFRRQRRAWEVSLPLGSRDCTRPAVAHVEEMRAAYTLQTP